MDNLLQRRRRHPNEVPIRSFSIYNQCRECRGWEGDDRSLAAEVLACPNIGCILWPVRSTEAAGADSYPTSEPLYVEGSDYGAKKVRGERIRDFCADCQGVSLNESKLPIRECSDAGCWLWPWRQGSLSLDY